MSKPPIAILIFISDADFFLTNKQSSITTVKTNFPTRISLRLAKAKVKYGVETFGNS